MSYLLFMDESGHDHRVIPYEIHGGVAIYAGKLWPFIQAMHALEQASFGTLLQQFGLEVKGTKLLDSPRIKWANQGPWMDDDARRKHCLAFLNKNAEHRTPGRDEFTAYGQACLTMARGIFSLLAGHDAVLFAAVIPASGKPPRGPAKEYLRKDQVFLLERFFYFLESKQQPGLLVMDETEKQRDRSLVRQMENYFSRSQAGRQRTTWIVPVPFFVASDMTCAVQAADVCIYCLNWGYRVPSWGMDARVRPVLQQEFEAPLRRLQFRGQGYRDGQVFNTCGIVYVADPYASQEGKGA